jgi:hypothetical protein
VPFAHSHGDWRAGGDRDGKEKQHYRKKSVVSVFFLAKVVRFSPEELFESVRRF